MTTALYAGTFDPFTLGHLDVARQTLKIVDLLYIVISQKEDKTTYLSAPERHDAAYNTLVQNLDRDDFERCRLFVSFGKELTVDSAMKLGATVLVRGLRNANDFQYERDMAQYNLDLAPHITTMFVLTKPELAHVSSSAVKSLIGKNGWKQALLKYVAPEVVETLVEKHMPIEKGYTVVK